MQLFQYQESGTGRPFHFQHGLGSNLLQPQSLLAELAGVRLISMDCPGHGQAMLPADTLPSFDFYADRLMALMDHLGVEKALFGGISMGAGISTNIALRYPDRVLALVLVRPAWLDQKTPDNLAILVDAARWIGKDNGLERFAESADFTAIQQRLPKAAQSILGVFAETQRPEIPTVLRAMVNDAPFSDLNALQKIDVPCLLIGNEDDPLHPYEMAEAMHQKINNSKIIKVASRYLADKQHREEVYQNVTKFITNL